MRRFNRWLCLVLLLIFSNCRDNLPAAKQQISPVKSLDSSYSQLVMQFNADSARVRLMMLLSPT
jgi:hypothetical protein